MLILCDDLEFHEDLGICTHLGWIMSVRAYQLLKNIIEFLNIFIHVMFFIFQTIVETLTYTPFAMCSFYFVMSLLESKPFHEAVAEVAAKFLPTYKVSSVVQKIVLTLVSTLVHII